MICVCNDLHENRGNKSEGAHSISTHKLNNNNKTDSHRKCSIFFSAGMARRKCKNVVHKIYLNKTKTIQKKHNNHIRQIHSHTHTHTIKCKLDINIIYTT